MKWNVTNALNRDVERQHLNKILAEIQAAINAVESNSQEPNEDVRAIVGGMVEGNSEQGISVTYNSPTAKLDFAVNDFIISLTGDVSGRGTVSSLRDVAISVTIDPDKLGIPEAPIDSNAYWRLGGHWEPVPWAVMKLDTVEGDGVIVHYSDEEDRAAYVTRIFEAAAGELTITNASGVDGNPLYGLADLVDTGVGTSPVQLFTRDAKGRVEGTKDADTDNLPEGLANLYFTDERAQDAVGAVLANTPDIELSYTDATPSIEANLTATIHASLDLADSAVQTVVAGTNITVDNTDPQNPVISSSGGSGSVPTSRNINTTAPLTGGGNLAADLTLGISAATTSAAGSMSGADKTKLDSIASGATAYTDAAARAAVIASSIVDGDTTHSPSGDAVFDALALKADDSAVVKTSGAQSGLAGNKSWTGVHTFGSSVVILGNTVTLDGNANKNFFYRDADGTSRGLVLSELSTRNLNLRSYDASGAVRGEISVGADFVISGGSARPSNDNLTTCASASTRWSVVYAGTGTINTSDAREKSNIRPLTTQELSAGLDLAAAARIYQWNAAIAEKGIEAARLHCGPTVQSVIAIMESHGLDPFRYGFVCYDEWDETPEQRDPETGDVIQEHIPSGDRYSLRPDELAAFRDAALAQNQATLDERLKALESA